MSIRVRRAISRVSIAASFVILAAVVLVPGIHHRSLAGGVFLCVTSVISIVAGLLYLHSTRGQS